MNWREILAANFRLENLLFLGLQVIFIAVIFEFIAWWLGRRIENWTSPLIPGDAGRDPSWRTRRRTLLRQTPKLISRSLCYVVGVLLVFHVFNIPVLPLSIGLGAIALLFGAGAVPLLRDALQGYAIFAEDTLAPGDVVEINGHRGQVEKVSLRSVWLKDENGRTHSLSNRNVLDVVIVQRRAEEAPARAKPFDPLDEPPVRAVAKPTKPPTK
jgi:small conductance mechanosensitive channel